MRRYLGGKRQSDWGDEELSHRKDKQDPHDEQERGGVRPAARERDKEERR